MTDRDFLKQDIPPQRLSRLAQRFLWVDNPHAVALAVRGLLVVCALLLLVDVFYHRHGYFNLELWWAFYAFVGFVAFTVIVLAAGQLRRLIRRDENYYGARSVHSDPMPDAELDIVRWNHGRQSGAETGNDGGKRS